MLREVSEAFKETEVGKGFLDNFENPELRLLGHDFVSSSPLLIYQMPGWTFRDRVYSERTVTCNGFQAQRCVPHEFLIGC